MDVLSTKPWLTHPDIFTLWTILGSAHFQIKDRKADHASPLAPPSSSQSRCYCHATDLAWSPQLVTAAEVWALCSTEWNCVCTIETWITRGESTVPPGPPGSQSQGCSTSLRKAWEGGQPVCLVSSNQ